jgi:hypothetical protein
MIYESLKKEEGIFKNCYNTVSRFSSNKTNYILSDSENTSSNDKFVNEDEEILILEQDAGKARDVKFKYIRAPYNKNIAVYTVKTQNGVDITIKTTLLKINNSLVEILPFLGNGGALITDDSNTIMYYIKFLSDTAYSAEVTAATASQLINTQYNACVNAKKLNGTLNTAITSCKAQYKML